MLTIKALVILFLAMWCSYAAGYVQAKFDSEKEIKAMKEESDWFVKYWEENDFIDHVVKANFIEVD